jgi:transposase
MAKQRIVTDEERHMIAEAYTNGLSNDKISKKYGYSFGAIWRALEAFNVPRRPTGRHKPDNCTSTMYVSVSKRSLNYWRANASRDGISLSEYVRRHLPKPEPE